MKIATLINALFWTVVVLAIALALSLLMGYASAAPAPISYPRTLAWDASPMATSYRVTLNGVTVTNTSSLQVNLNVQGGTNVFTVTAVNGTNASAPATLTYAIRQATEHTIWMESSTNLPGGWTAFSAPITVAGWPGNLFVRCATRSTNIVQEGPLP